MLMSMKNNLPLFPLLNPLWLLGFIILTTFESTQGQPKLVNTKISSDITMKIPNKFIAMSDGDMWQRVSSYRKSIALYTDLNRIIQLGVNHAFSTWEEGDLEMLKSVYKASILELFDKVDFSIEEIKEIKGREYVVFEFTSTIYGDRSGPGSRGSITRYYYLQYTIYSKGTLVIDFSCPTHLKDEWQNTAKSIMNSVKVK